MAAPDVLVALDSGTGYALSSVAFAPARVVGKCAMAVHAKQVIVHGRVQGVGFRYFVQNVGTRLGLVGNVRNRPDSTVEIHVEGAAGKIDAFIRLVGRGPSLARVQRIEVFEIAAKGIYSSFLIEGW